MNYYLLPGAGIFGGIKVAYQFCDSLISLGVPMTIAAPNSEACSWFKSSAPICDRDDVLANVAADDALVFSLPHDYKDVVNLPCRVIFHCQGTDPMIDPILSDGSIVILSCWEQAAQYISSKTKKLPLHTGISISDSFFYNGEPKMLNQVAYMPRRGKEISYAAMEANSDLEFAAIEDMHEEDVAELMKSSAYFLATSEGEWFGLPALEAMAAGCLVLSVPVLGGMEYLHHGANSFVVEREEIPLKLKELHMMKNSEFLSRVRHLAISTAMSYSRAQQLKVLSQLVDGNEGLFNASFA